MASSTYLRTFASDRSHMLAEDGSWLADPPFYPCIVAADGGTNSINRFRDMTLPLPSPAAGQHGGYDRGELLTAVAATGVTAPARDSLLGDSGDGYGVVLTEPQFLAAFGVVAVS